MDQIRKKISDLFCRGGLTFGQIRTKSPDGKYTGCFAEVKGRPGRFMFCDEEGRRLMVTAAPPQWQPVLRFLAQGKAGLTLTLDPESRAPAEVELREDFSLTWGGDTLFLWALERCLSQAAGEPGPGPEPGRTPIPESETQLAMVYSLIGHTLPPVLREWARNQLEGLSAGSLGCSSSERRHIVRGLQMVLSIDWTPSLAPLPHPDEIRKLLDAGFFGLQGVKRRVLEVAAQIRNAGRLPRYGILLVGPPGTGKSMIAKSIARLMQLNIIYVDISSAGNESEMLCGSPIVYGNAKPGSVLSGMASTRSASGVLLINELDKTGENASRGSVSDSLLSLLDGQGFVDNYLGVPIPTEGLFAVATANDADRIPGPLLSRFLRIDIPPYSREEKQEILTRFVLPKALRNAGLPEDAFRLSDEALDCLVSSYASTPGIRDVEQMAERLTGDYLLREDSAQPRDLYTPRDLRRIFGPEPRIRREFSAQPGLVMGAFIDGGSCREFIVEACLFRGEGRIEILGCGDRDDFRDEIRTAVLCLRNTMRLPLRKADICVRIVDELPSSARGFLGLPVYAAVFSACFRKTLRTGSLFCGGTDLLGNVQFNAVSPQPVLELMARRGLETLFLSENARQMLSDCGFAGEIEVVSADRPEHLMLLAGESVRREGRAQ